MQLTVTMRHRGSHLALTVRVKPEGLQEHQQLLAHCSAHRPITAAVPAAAMRQWRALCKAGAMDQALALQQPVVALWDQLALEPRPDGTAIWHGLIADGLISRALVERLRWHAISTIEQLIAVLQMLELENSLSHGPADSGDPCGCPTESDRACSEVPSPASAPLERGHADHPA